MLKITGKIYENYDSLLQDMKKIATVMLKKTWKKGSNMKK